MSEIRKIDQDKKAYLNLLLLADPDEAMIDRYLADGGMFVLFEGETAVSVCVVTELSTMACELKNLITDERFQRQGYGTRLVRYIMELYGESFDEMLVGTSNAVDSSIRFYQSLGFVYSHTVPNFFVDYYPEPILENGVQCRDMVYLRAALPKAKENTK
ncbi:GNAT family N-acetyltransferase [Hydrogenoanaerobacterium sp.]|uniref:GNAT family N-acetyltransferase n=1 Tax=Hydrogenoanaerobacterium sp. TaxID=2953763 RepID=UPI0028A2229B|nr:GNAT family N-acetyltransferase [Hydrogenoanaerobacterium sp.]